MLPEVGTGALTPKPAIRWGNGHCEGFNGKLRDGCLNGEIFDSLREAHDVIEKWHVEYKTRRPAIGRPYRRANASWLQQISSHSLKL